MSLFQQYHLPNFLIVTRFQPPQSPPKLGGELKRGIKLLQQYHLICLFEIFSFQFVEIDT